MHRPIDVRLLDASPALSRVDTVLRDHLLPLAVYFTAFAVLTWPALGSFTTALYGGYDDLPQNLWDLWWVNKALTELGQSPYHTTWLHYPAGTSLIGHTLSPLNGLIAIPLQRVLRLPVVYNLLLVVSFPITGWATYWLCRTWSASRGGALLGGFLFAFSAYRCGHAHNHLWLITALQWMPLYLLCLLRLLTQPSIPRALFAAGALLLVTATELQYVLHCGIAGALLYGIRAWRTRSLIFALRRPYVLPFATFLLTSAATSGVFVWALMSTSARDPLYGTQNPRVYSADLLSPFIPGGVWRFGAWTEAYWGLFHQGWIETSIYLGWGAILLGILAWRHRPRPTPTAYIWCASIIVVFYALSLGPVLRVWDTPTVVPMPYALLTRILPFFKMAGVTVRFMVLPMLALAVLASCGWTWLARDLTRWRIAGLAALLAFILFETFPRPMLLTSPEVPPWVQALRRMPDSGGIVDLVTYPSDCLYHQTVHEKPFAFGYISREPASVAMEKLLKELAIRQKDYVQLHERWKYDYLIAPASPPIAGLEVLYEDATVRIYSLRPRQMP